MRGLSQRVNKGVIAGLAIVGVSGIGGLTAGFTTRAGWGPDTTTVVAATIARIAPSDIVNLRFPGEWVDAAEVTDAVGVDAAPQRVVLASADGSFNLLNPQPIYPIAPVYPPAEAAVPMPPARPKSAVLAAAGPADMALASVSSKPVAPPKPAVRSSAVLNDSQIASIKRRLNLTPEQERYWPAVDAELRKMEYSKKSPQGASRMASIDMSKVNVEGLKSAGYPLVMSFSDDQRRELKSLAHLLGLESVMAGL